MRFVPLGVVDGISEEQRALLAAPEHRSAPAERVADRVGRIEIEFPTGVRVRAEGLVNEKALSRVLRALKGVV